jgi:hypothetical protein
MKNYFRSSSMEERLGNTELGDSTPFYQITAELAQVIRPFAMHKNVPKTP